MTVNAKASQCPVSHADHTVSTDAYGHYAVLDSDRERSRFLFNDTTEDGFWMIQRYDDVVAGFQNHGVFTNDVTSAMRPSRAAALLPQMLNGEEHAKLRRVLNPFFSPAAVRRMDEFATARAIELIEELRPTGSCDFVTEFAIRYPTDVFLRLLGLPVGDGEFFLPWSETLFAGLLGGDLDEAMAARAKIFDYFEQAVNERRSAPRDPRTDLVSRLVEATIDGEPISQSDILTICMTLMLAGLDTTRSALGYIYADLARNEDHRRLVTENPQAVPEVVEEFLRLYPLVFQAGRYVGSDTDFEGLSMERGDIVWLGIGSANRDPRKFERPEEFIPGRAGGHQHLAFGAGPHRCLGMHLARHELAVVVREWHARIPDYRIAPGTRLEERGFQLTLRSLPLEWATDDHA
jgi:cytochrome P450